MLLVLVNGGLADMQMFLHVFGLVGVPQADLIQFLCLAALLLVLFAVKGQAQACIRMKSRGLQCQCQERGA